MQTLSLLASSSEVLLEPERDDFGQCPVTCPYYAKKACSPYKNLDYFPSPAWLLSQQDFYRLSPPFCEERQAQKLKFPERTKGSFVNIDRTGGLETILSSPQSGDSLPLSD